MSAIMMDIPDNKGTAVKICKYNYKNDVTGVICITFNQNIVLSWYKVYKVNLLLQRISIRLCHVMYWKCQAASQDITVCNADKRVICLLNAHNDKYGVSHTKILNP